MSLDPAGACVLERSFWSAVLAADKKRPQGLWTFDSLTFDIRQIYRYDKFIATQYFIFFSNSPVTR